MASLNIDIEYFAHWKTKRLIRLLGKGSEVLPLKLWAYAARYFSKDGRLTEISAQEIEEEVGWWGATGKMVEAMLTVGGSGRAGFLEKDGDTYVVHDWLEHQGHISAFTTRAKKGAKARWDRMSGNPVLDDASSNASSIPTSNASSNALTNETNDTKLTKLTTTLPSGVDAAAFLGLEAEAQQLLNKEGFTPEDPIRSHQFTSVGQVRVAIQNADHLHSIGKLKDRRAYIVKAIEERYALSDGAGRREMQLEKAAKEKAAAQSKAQAMAAQRQAEKDQAERDAQALANLTPQQLETLKQAALNKLHDPTMRSKLSAADVSTNICLRAMVIGQMNEQTQSGAKPC